MPEEALRNILKLVEGSDEVEDAHALQILLQSIKTSAEKGLGRSTSEDSCLLDCFFVVCVCALATQQLQQPVAVSFGCCMRPRSDIVAGAMVANANTQFAQHPFLAI